MPDCVEHSAVVRIPTLACCSTFGRVWDDAINKYYLKLECRFKTRISKRSVNLFINIVINVVIFIDVAIILSV